MFITVIFLNNYLKIKSECVCVCECVFELCAAMVSTQRKCVLFSRKSLSRQPYTPSANS